jgi:serine protease AprX
MRLGKANSVTTGPRANRTRLLAGITALVMIPGIGLGSASGPTPVSGTSAASGEAWSGIWRDGNYTGTSLWDVRNIMQLGWGASANLSGKGVGIALIDTGVSPVFQLSPSLVVNGPDLSFESQSPNLRYLDTYGHGSHMAGIMVGNGYTDGHVGLAHNAKLTSVKVGTATGSVDVTQIIAAIDWVVENKNHDPAYPIRVINLSYGSGGRPSSLTDPLQFAVEQAWKAGIVVVAAAGNDAGSVLSDPASDPFVLAVGAAHTAGTWTNSDDTLHLHQRQDRQP